MEYLYNLLHKEKKMNFQESVLYQFYPLRLPGVPETNNWDWSNWNGASKAEVNRLKTLENWIPHLKNLGINAVYFSPIFQSDKHGYDTRDYYTIDSRLGSNQDFAQLSQKLHENGIAVILDGVFNHTGRGFWAFRDVQQNRQNSAYKDWYWINWQGNSPYNDGFGYEGWEGHMDLVKLNLQNPAVKEHIFGAIQKWSDEFQIDGLRLDVAYSLDNSFLTELNQFTKKLPTMFGQGNFPLIGESIHSHDYSRLLEDSKCHSCTNYEAYKGLYSSLNDNNLFELAYSLNRQFGEGGIFKNKSLLSFTDNHDVSRFASILRDPEKISLGYKLLFTIPGVPCIYYGSEWGIKGNKQEGDNSLRPALNNPEWNELTDIIAKFLKLRINHKALIYGTYKNICINNSQLVFERKNQCPYTGQTETIIVAINISDDNCLLKAKSGYPNFEGIYGNYENLLDGSTWNLNGDLNLERKSIVILSPK